jgi:hypothetical protein
MAWDFLEGHNGAVNDAAITTLAGVRAYCRRLSQDVQ